jgi:hypothetical protein
MLRRFKLVTSSPSCQLESAADHIRVRRSRVKEPIIQWHVPFEEAVCRHTFPES